MAEPLYHLGPSSQTLAVLPSTGPPTDAIELITADHRRIRRLCRVLDDAVRWERDSGSGWMLAHVWERLAGLLDVHTRAEEEICYVPIFTRLPRAAEIRREAIADHNDIREVISEASLQPAGSVLWWRAVRAAVATSMDHLDHEEREVLAEFRLRVTMSRRRELGRQWCEFIAATRRDASPQGGRAARAAGDRRTPAASIVRAREGQGCHSRTMPTIA